MTKRQIGFLIVILGGIFWGLGGTVSQKLFQTYHLEVGSLVLLRLFIAGTLMLSVQAIFKDRSQVFGVWKNRFMVGRLIIYSIFGMLAVQYTYMAAIDTGNAAIATLLQYLAPVLIIFYMLLRKQSVLSKKDLVTVFLALLGCFLLLTNGSLDSFSVPAISVFWGLISAFALAFYTLYAVPLLKHFDSLVVVGWAMILGGIGMTIIHPPWTMNWPSLPLEAYGYLAFVIIFGTMIAFWFYIESLQVLAAKETSLLSSIEPLAAVVATVFWLHEPFGLLQWIGALCILVMIIYMALAKAEQRPIRFRKGKVVSVDQTGD